MDKKKKVLLCGLSLAAMLAAVSACSNTVDGVYDDGDGECFYLPNGNCVAVDENGNPILNPGEEISSSSISGENADGDDEETVKSSDSNGGDKVPGDSSGEESDANSSSSAEEVDLSSDSNGEDGEGDGSSSSSSAEEVDLSSSSYSEGDGASSSSSVRSEISADSDGNVDIGKDWMETPDESDKDWLDSVKTEIGDENIADKFPPVIGGEVFDPEHNDYFCFTEENEWLRIDTSNLKQYGIPWLWNNAAWGNRKKYTFRFDEVCQAIFVKPINQ